MTPERYQQVCQMFDEAQQHATTARAAFLDRACPDPSVRADVEKLLADAEAASREGFLRGPGPLNRHAAPPPEEAADALVGRRVGPHEIEKRIGRGGMGVVYQARQVDLNRTIALKMIRDRALAGPEDLTRFRVEAEAVARLHHPNIVQIYDVGEHEGLPYLPHDAEVAQL